MTNEKPGVQAEKKFAQKVADNMRQVSGNGNQMQLKIAYHDNYYTKQAELQKEFDDLNMFKAGLQ